MTLFTLFKIIMFCWTEFVDKHVARSKDSAHAQCEDALVLGEEPLLFTSWLQAFAELCDEIIVRKQGRVVTYRSYIRDFTVYYSCEWILVSLLN